jgi:hypothetical protein
VGFRLGIGGRAFGVRGGISNRGFGVGVGPFSAGSSWGGSRPRRSGRSGSGGGGRSGKPGYVGAFFTVLLALILGLVSLCSHRTHTPVADPPPTAKPDASICPPQAPTTTTTTAPDGGVVFPKVTLPDVTGQNGQIAEDRLKRLGFTHLDFESANPKYSMVLVSKNWTVVSTYPPPCSVVDPYDQVVVNVTKP